MSTKIAKHKNIIFGLGTGRCGTESLATLLNQQHNSFVTHERYRWRLGWEHCESQVESIFKRKVQKETENFALYGDVAFSWLPYVDLILQLEPRAKFICLKRKKEDTVNSWLRKVPDFNHWQKHNGSKYRFGHWSRSFPKFDSCFSRRQAISMYWEYYYAKANEYKQKYSDNFRIFSLNSLNNSRGQRKILEFAGIINESQIYDVGIRKNKQLIELNKKGIN